eukprot:TRINITY_DN5757_c0_g1_i3.p1 TRINITY_DN5757_c0_g1~~TRINITY_DN5757_c0_g1_i3.p1  ORF type:complete len:320 (-),score=52.19 TRINITY_DN5757_c0_g1_i3:69-1028(-)
MEEYNRYLDTDGADIQYESSPIRDSSGAGLDQKADIVKLSDESKHLETWDILSDGEGYHVLIDEHGELTSTNPKKKQLFKEAGVKGVFAITMGRDGTIYYSRSDKNVIAKVTTDLQLTIIAGKEGQSGFHDGLGEEALFSEPRFLAVDSKDNIYVSDNGNHLIRKITKEGVVTTILGTPQLFREERSLYFPNGLVVDRDDFVYFCESGNRVIRKYDPFHNKLITIAGKYDDSLDREDTREYGNALNTKFSFPYHLKCDLDGNLYVEDGDIIKLSPVRFSLDNYHKLSTARKAKIRTILLIAHKKRWIKDIVFLILKAAF